jgi:hypothetical protein
MDGPYITTENVIATYKLYIPASYNIPIYDDYPSDSDIVRFGLYVSDVHTVQRVPYQLAVQQCGSIYHATDQFKVTYVSYQDDPHNVQVNNIISDIVRYVDPLTGKQLMDGYFNRHFDQVLTYGPNREKHDWTFHMVRLEFQT